MKTSKLFFASKIFLLKIRISGENEFFAVFRNLRHFFKTVNTLENKKGLIKVLQQSVKNSLKLKEKQNCNQCDFLLDGSVMSVDLPDPRFES